MLAQPRAQQRLFGAVAAYQAGKLKNPSAKIKEMAERVSMEDAKDFARTKHEGLPEKKASRGRILLSALQRMPSSSSDEIVSLIRNSLLRQHAAIPSHGSELDFLRTVLNDRVTGSPFSLYARLLRAPRFKSVIPPKPKPGIMQKVMQYVKPDSDSADKVVRDWRKFLSDGRPETTAMLSPVFQKAHKLSDKKASAKQEFSQPENWAWMEAVCMFKRAADPEAVYNKVLAPGYDPTRLLQAASSHKAWKGVSGVLARNYARSLDASDSAGLQSKVKALNKEKVIKFIRDNASLFENAGTRQPVAALKLSAAQRLHATWVLKEASGILTDDQVRWQGGIPGMDRGIENAAKWMKQKAWDAGWGLGGVLFKPKPLPITSPAQKTQQPRVNAGG